MVDIKRLASAHMSGVIEIANIGECGVVTLSAPDRRNAICPAMREELLRALRKFARDKECKVIMITGADSHFCAGGDMRNGEIDANGPEPFRTYSNSLVLQDIIRLIATGPKPVIAAVEGAAFGAGFSIAAACDVVIAGSGARFCASFGKVGLMPDAGIMWSLPRRIGAAKASYILLTARVVNAEEALQYGLADDVVPEGKAYATALERGRALSSIAPLSIAAIRSVMSRAAFGLENVLAAEREIQPLLTLSEDYSLGRKAFIERRPPKFEGK